MSSIRRRKNGYYFIDLMLPNGTRIRESLKTKDKNVAKYKASTMESQLLDHPRFERILLTDFVKEFKVWAEPRRSKGTLTNYVSILKRFSDTVNVKYLDEVTMDVANKFVNALIKEGRILPKKKECKNITYGPITGRGVNYYIRTLRGIFNVAKKEFKCIADNPFEHVSKVKEPTIKPRRFTRDELVLFFKEFQESTPEYYPYFLFYLVTGLRRKEPLSLEWNDIDFENGCITVHGKGDKYRVIPMLPIARQILEDRRSFERPFPRAGSTISHVFSHVRKSLDVKGLKLHSLRKTFSTLLADQGVSDFFIQQWLGHSDKEVTNTYYIGLHDQVTQRKLSSFTKKISQSLPE